MPEVRKTLEKYILIRYTRRTGTIDTVLEAHGTAGLQLWAVNNTTRSKDCFVFEYETGKVIYLIKGMPNGCPKVEDTGLGNIDNYCPGLLAEIHRQSKK